MPTAEDVARGIFSAIANKDLQAVERYLAEDCVQDFVAIREVRGRREIRRLFEELLTAFPDFQIAPRRVVADGEAAVVQWTATGTFTGGPFIGIEPTGRHVEIRGADVMEVADGLVQRDTIYYDGASFARQIGMLPRAESSADRAIVAVFNAATQLRQRFQSKGEAPPR